jgi:DNA replication protein DnaC
MSDLYEIEHGRGLHAFLRLPGCAACQQVPELPPAIPPDLPAAPSPRPPTAVGDLQPIGAGLKRIIARIKVDQPDVPDEGPRGIDGGPWCERCHGARWLRLDVADRTDPNFGKTIQCPDCRSGYLLQRNLERMIGGVPSKYRDCTFDNFPATRAAQRTLIGQLRHWLTDPHAPWLYLFGPTGTGKTSLAVAVLRESMEQLLLSGAFKMAPDVLELLRDTYRTREAYEADEHDMLDLLRECDLLVLDDLGSEHHKPGQEDWADEKLFQVIAGRDANKRRTIITSNLSLSELREHLGHPRTPSRIEEMCQGRWVIDMTGLPDLRRRGRVALIS